MIASASISTSIFGETRAVIAIMVLAGRISQKKLSVGFANFFPIRNVGEEHTRADDIFQRSSGPLQRAFNVLEGLNRLRIRITRADDLVIDSSRSCTRNVDICTHANRTRVTDDWLPRCSA